MKNKMEDEGEIWVETMMVLIMYMKAKVVQWHAPLPAIGQFRVSVVGCRRICKNKYKKTLGIPPAVQASIILTKSQLGFKSVTN